MPRGRPKNSKNKPRFIYARISDLLNVFNSNAVISIDARYASDLALQGKEIEYVEEIESIGTRKKEEEISKLDFTIH